MRVRVVGLDSLLFVRIALGGVRRRWMIWQPQIKRERARSARAIIASVDIFREMW